MWPAAEVTRTLRERGELWEPVRGLTSLRGDVLSLYHRVQELLAGLAHAEGLPEWRLAPGMDLRTLARAEYFRSFPQWLTAAGHLGDDPAALEAVAAAADPATAAARAVGPAGCALSPALCYHAWDRLAGTTVDDARGARMTAEGTCWRHEGDRLRPLERGWGFTMRELVHAGSPAAAGAFLARGRELAATVADVLGLDHRIVPATDPFFAPTARGKQLLQTVKGLKHELVLPLGDGRTLAAASFNDHETFFGERFDIRLPGGEPAATACVAFGLERWVLAFLVAHGPDARAWPDFDTHPTPSRRIA